MKKVQIQAAKLIRERAKVDETVALKECRIVMLTEEVKAKTDQLADKEKELV